MEVVAPNMNIPALCQFKPSSVEENKIGVWAKHQIKAETQFGPYEGEKKKVSDTCDPYYSWEIKGPKGRRLFCIDASDPKKSNWMRYIKCARYYEEQNIVAVQHEKQIYYKTIKDINANEELLGWYSAPFDSMGDGSTMCTTEASTSKKRFTCEKGEGTESSELADQEDVKGPKIKPVLGKKSKTFSDPKAACKSDEQHTSQKTAKWSNKDEKSSNKRKRKGADSEDAKVMKKIKKLKTNVGKGAKAKDKKVLGKGKQILISIGAKKKKMQDKKSVKYSLKKIGKITSIKEKVAKHASKMKSVKAVEGVKLSVGKKTAKSKLTKQTGAAGHEKAMAKLGKQVVQLKIPKLSTGTDLEKKGTSKKQLGKAKISSTAGSSGKAAKHKKIAEGDKKSGKIKKQIAKKKTESSTGHPGKIAKQSAKIKTVKQATDSSAKKTAKLKKLKPANVGKFKSQTAKVEVKKPGRKMGKGSAVRKLVNINRKKMFLPTLKSKTKGIGRRTRSNASSFAGKQLTVRKRKIPSHKKKDSASAKLAKKSVDTTDETNETPLSSCSGDEGVTSAVMDDTYRKENEGMQTEKDMEDYPYDHREVAEKITDIIAEEMPYAEEEDSINSNDKLSNNKENDTDSVGSDIIEGIQDVPLNMDINNAKENNSVSDVDDIPDDIVTSTGEDSMNDNMKQCSEVLKDIILDIQNSEKNLAVDSNEQNLIHGDANETVCISVLKENKTEGMTLEVDDVHVEEPREELAMDDLPELDKNVEIGGLYEDCDDDYRMPILERVAADFNVNLFTRGDDTDIRVTQSITSYLNPENTNKEEGITNMDMKTEIYKCQNHITHVDIKKENDNQPTEAPKTIDPPSKCDNITYDEKCDHPVSQCMKAESPNQPNNGSMYFKNKMHANIFVSTEDNQYETEDMCESESQEINHSETNNLHIDEVEPANEHPFNVNEEGDLNSACEEEEPVTPSSNPVLLVNEERDHDGVSEEPTTLSKEHLLTVNKKGDDSVCENKEPAVASIDPALTVDEMENPDEHDIVDESEKEHEVIEEIANNDDVLGIAHTAIDNYSYDNDDDDIDDDENDDGIDENSIQEGDSNSEGMPTNQHPVVIDNVNMHDDSDSKDDMCGDNKDDVFASSGEKTDKDIANDELEENSLDNHSIEKMESKDNNDECTGTKVVNEQSGFDSSEIVVFKKGWSGRHNFPKVYLPVQLDDSGKPIIYSDFREFRIDVNLTNKKVRGKRRKSYYKCQVCPCAVEFQHSLKRHYFNHHVQEKYKSIEPTKRPVKVAHQREKIRTRGTSFDEERRKRAHIFKDKAKVDEERFLSTEMGFQVESKARFRKAFHQETDTDRVFSCKICGKRLKSNKRLSNHMMMSHPQQYKLNCPKCSRHFLCQQSLERHLLLHSGVKPFSCRYCGKAFSTSTNARRHEKLHSGFRPHRCEECKITFIHATELQRHVSSNHGEFKALQSKFRIPVKTLEDDVIELPVHAPGEEHECPLCGKIFYKASSLKRHASHAHKHVQTRMAERKVENQAPDGYIEATDLSDTVPDKISQYLDGKIIPPEDEIGHVPTGVSQIRISNVHHISSFDDYASDEDSTAVGNAEDCESDDSNTSFTHGTEDCNLSGKSPGGQNEPHHIDNLMKNKSIKTNRISHLPEERFTGQSSNHTDHTQTVESIKKQNEIDIRKPPSALTRPPFRGSSGPKDFNPALLKRNKTSEGVSSSSQVMVTKETKECAEQGYSMVSNAKSVPSITQSSRHAGQSLQQFRSHPQNTAIDTKVVSSKMQASIQRVRSIAALKQLQYARAKAAAAQRTVTPKMPTGATSQASSTARPILQPRPIQAAPAVPSTGNVQFSSSTNRSTQQSTKVLTQVQQTIGTLPQQGAFVLAQPTSYVQIAPANVRPQIQSTVVSVQQPVTGSSTQFVMVQNVQGSPAQQFVHIPVVSTSTGQQCVVSTQSSTSTSTAPFLVSGNVQQITTGNIKQPPPQQSSFMPSQTKGTVRERLRVGTAAARAPGAKLAAAIQNIRAHNPKLSQSEADKRSHMHLQHDASVIQNKPTPITGNLVISVPRHTAKRVASETESVVDLTVKHRKLENTELIKPPSNEQTQENLEVALDLTKSGSDQHGFLHSEGLHARAEVAPILTSVQEPTVKICRPVLPANNVQDLTSPKMKAQVTSTVVPSNIHGKRLTACNVCGIVFKSVRALKEHVTTHESDWKYKCEYCFQLFQSHNALAAHRYKQHRTQTTYACSVCQRQFLNLSKLEQHQVVSHPNVMCDYVQMGQSHNKTQHQTSQSLTASTDIIIPKARVSTTIVKKSSSPPSNTVSGSPGTSTNTCTKCGMIFDDMTAFHKHIFQCAVKSGSGNRPKWRGKWGQKLKTQDLLKRRGASHTVAEKLRNKALKHNFSKTVQKSSNSLDTDVDQPVCQDCGRDFIDLVHLQKHLKMCPNRDQLKIANCQVELEKMMVGYSDDCRQLIQQHRCPHCKRQFTYIRSLKKHIEVCDYRRVTRRKEQQVVLTQPIQKQEPSEQLAKHAINNEQKFILWDNPKQKKRGGKRKRRGASSSQKNTKTSITTENVTQPLSDTDEYDTIRVEKLSSGTKVHIINEKTMKLILEKKEEKILAKAMAKHTSKESSVSGNVLDQEAINTPCDLSQPLVIDESKLGSSDCLESGIPSTQTSDEYEKESELHLDSQSDLLKSNNDAPCSDITI